MTSSNLIIGLLSATIRMATPLTIVCLGEIMSERSGILNLGLEGIMLVGAFTSFWVAYFTENLLMAVLVGIAVGGLIGLLHAVLTVTASTDQVVAGIAIWLLGVGLSSFGYRAVFGIVYPPPTIDGFNALNIPFLSETPILGRVLFQQDVFVYLAFFMVPIFAFVLYRTTFGIKVRAVGENPAAADTSGINVHRTRYLSVILGGMLAGLGGAYISLAYARMFTDYVTAGRGWIAIALTVFAGWDPFKALVGALLFGGVEAIELRLQVLGLGIPYEFFVVLPYVLTIVALFIVRLRKKTGAPAALGVPYKRGEGK
jgi:ABC-type uncharacterized transport system permease subunit